MRTIPLASLSKKSGSLNEAIAMAKKSLDVDPDLNMARYSLGMIYFENGQYEEADRGFQ